MKSGILAIGCSAGCFDSLLRILPELAPGFPLPVVVVIHMAQESENSLATSLASRCSVPVLEPEDKEPILPGVIYIAPPGYHLLADPEGVFSLSAEEPVNFSRPSIDVLFESIAYAYGSSAVGLVLSGANEDGADGLRRIANAGGLALVEDPDTAAYPTMPKAAACAVPSHKKMTVEQLASTLPFLRPEREGERWRL
jgi:two-component system, chemotaxis family, protein-glutamate methylesterase/glutaminase